jgi:voltage-gated potassium channel
MAGRDSSTSRSITALLLLVIIGSVGYRVIEGWSWFDCFYMTVITLATVGYGELQPMGVPARAFTVALIFGGVGTVAYALTSITHSIVRMEVMSSWERRRMRKEIDKLSDHFIVCGAGRVGLRVARQLHDEHQSLVVVDNATERVERVAGEGLTVLHGDATDEAVLVQAGIQRARGIVCALPSDADNVYVTLTARALSDSLRIVARVSDDKAASKMRKAGADHVISPVTTGAREITQVLLRPTVARFMELATQTSRLDLIIEEVRIDESSPLAGRTLREANIRGTLDVIVIAILRADSDMTFNPGADTRLEGGDNVIAIGSHAAMDALAERAMPPAARAV